MYKLLRRISSSFFPRPDQPWSEDATSTAPQIGRKRRFSSTEPDADAIAQPSSAKKQRGDSVDASEDASQRAESPVRTGRETEGVREVTQGVREVELEEGHTSSDIPVEAAAVPLPESPTLQPTQVAADAEGEVEPLPSDEPAATQVRAVEEESAKDETVSQPEVADATAIMENDHKESMPSDEEEIPGLTAGVEKKNTDNVETITETVDQVEVTQATANEVPAQDP